jgi:porphobilinogen synthase
MRENVITSADLIYPVFVQEGQNPHPWPRCRAWNACRSDALLPVAEECVKLGVPVLALFPVIDPALKTPDGIKPPTRKAWCRVCARAGDRFPNWAC